MSISKIYFLSAAMIWGLLLAGCTDPMPMNGSADMASPYPCFANPMTHVQIINACTSAVAIDQPATSPKFSPGTPLLPLP
jgi:hypothetical protein